MTLALEKEVIDAAIVTTTQSLDGYAGGIIATTGEGVRSCAGSKFVGAHTLEVLGQALRGGFKKIGVVALPCQVRALRKMQLYDIRKQNINKRVRFVLGLFCNWSFSAQEFLSFLSSRVGEKEITRFDVPPPPANELVIESKGGKTAIPLNELRPFIQSACGNCPDLTSEFADLSVGMLEGRPGWNTLVIRNEIGSDLVDTAQELGIIEIEPFPSENLAHLQKASINKRERVSRIAS